MRKLTKWIVCLFALALVISCTGVVAFAAENDALSLTGPETALVDERVVISVNAEAADLVTDGVLVVSYDAERLSYVDAVAGSAWSEDADLSLADNCTAADGKVTLAFAAVDAAAVGEVINLEFAVLQPGTAEIRVSAEESKLTGAENYDLGASFELTIEEVTPPAPTTWTVTFVDGVTEEVLDTVTVEDGEAAVAPEVENHDGYYFLGWDKDFSVVTADMTVTAIFCVGEEGCPAERFTDVNYKAWYHEAVDYVIDAGYMNGTGATTFEPDVTTTRAMLVTILYRMAGTPEAQTEKLPFTDVVEGAWYYDAVIWAYENEITLGMSATTFCPDMNLNREQLVTFLFRYAAYADYDLSIENPLSSYGFTDIDEISDWALKAMSWAVDHELVNGVSETEKELAPTDVATRAMIAKLVMTFDEIFGA